MKAKIALTFKIFKYGVFKWRSRQCCYHFDTYLIVYYY